MNKLEETIKKKLTEKPILLMTHLVLGYPSFEINRAVIRQMVENGVDLIEMLGNRMLSDCCGMGGLLMVVDQEASDKIGKNRVQQAKDTGASALITACPACYDQFRRNADGLDIYEMTDIIMQVL